MSEQTLVWPAVEYYVALKRGDLMIQHEWIAKVVCKKPDSEGYTLRDSIYLAFWKRHNCKDGEQISTVKGLGQWGADTKGHWGGDLG